MREKILTSNERWDLLYQNKVIDCVPLMTYIDSVSARVCGVSSKEYYFNPQLAYECQRNFLDKFNTDDGTGFNIPSAYAADFMGGEIEIAEVPNHSIPKVISRAVKKEEDLKNLVIPRTLENTFHAKKIFEFNRIKFKKEGKVSVFGGSPLTIVEGIIGIENLCRWSALKPEVIHHLLRVATDYIYLMADRYLEEFGKGNVSAGISMPLESNEILSPKQFERYSVPYIVEILETFKKKEISVQSIHLCGNHRHNLPIIKECFPFHHRTLITVGKEMDIEKIAKFFGEEFIIGGNVSNEALLFSKPREVYVEAVDIIRKMKYHPGGFVLTPECTMSYLTPSENIKAMIQAIEDEGFY